MPAEYVACMDICSSIGYSMAAPSEVNHISREACKVRTAPRPTYDPWSGPLAGSPGGADPARTVGVHEEEHGALDQTDIR